jgi:predicted outer membrane repeat protein
VRVHGNQAGSHGGAVYLTTRASQSRRPKAAFDDCTFEQTDPAVAAAPSRTSNQGRPRKIARTSFDGNEAELGGGAVATDRESSTAFSQVSVGKNRGGSGDPDSRHRSDVALLDAVIGAALEEVVDSSTS